MTARAGRYEVFCVETGKGSHASIFVCSITDLELGREIGTVDFEVQKKPDKWVVVKYPDSFRKAFGKVFGNVKKDVFAGGKSSKIAENLEWMVKTVIEKGVWDPGKEFADKIQEVVAKRKGRKLGAIT